MASIPGNRPTARSRRLRSTGLGLGGFLLAGLFAGMPCAPILAGAAPPSSPGWAALERARDLFRAYHADSALPIVTQVLESPEAERDSSLSYAAGVLRGAGLAVTGRAREAEPILRSVIRRAEVAGDSVQLGQSLRYLAYALQLLGRFSESGATYARLLALATAREDSLNEAYARLGIAYRDLLENRLADAEVGYRQAIVLFRSQREHYLERNAMVGLCRCYDGMARIDHARRCYQTLETLCREAGDVYSRVSALNNLGAIEHMTGDLAAAAEDYRAAVEINRASADLVGGVVPTTNLALIQIEMGQLREAGEVLAAALDRTRMAGFRLGEVRVLERLAELRATQQRYAEAVELVRRGLALADSIPADQRTATIWTFGRTLARMDRVKEAIDIMNRESRRIGETAPPYSAAALDIERSTQLLRTGRPQEALDAAQRAVRFARRGQSLDLEFRARVQQGMGELRLGRVAKARATLETASDLWETNRDRQRDPESREYLSASARRCVSGLLECYLADTSGSERGAGDRGDRGAGRAARIFAAIERFKARTLRERMAGPWKLEPVEENATVPVTLGMIQRSALREGELLIETFIGPTVGLMLAVTPHESRIVMLPDRAELSMRLTRLRSLAANAGGAAEIDFVERAGRRIGEWVFAPVSDLLTACSRVILSPDEDLGLIPWAAVTGPAAGASPLIAEREIVLVPSAGILSDLRARTAGPAPESSPRTLALAGFALSESERLPGASREVRWLGRHYAGVETGGDAIAATAAGGELEPYDVLHLAAHTALDDEHPWRSGIRLGRNPDTGTPEYLRAERIASLRLHARLAVLSSCESAAGKVSSGEGVQGLSAAFVSAGVPATVATLWPVSDRFTERLMREFYRQLASGRTVAAALRAAQLETRAHAETRHPFYWAGFVVLGDGDVRVPLRPKIPLATPAAAAILLAALALWVWRRRRSRSALTIGDAGTLSE